METILINILLFGLMPILILSSVVGHLIMWDINYKKKTAAEQKTKSTVPLDKI